MLMFLYADAPMHMGAGVSLGGVDLPIQRERHTDYPMAQGSGLKGALRHHLTARSASPEEQKRATARRKITVVFGPDGDEEGRPQDHAGAAAFGDGRLLLFPVRSLIGTFAYCTSALAVGRLCRDMEVAGLSQSFSVPTPPAEEQALAPPKSKVMDGGKAFLEDFDVQVKEEPELRGLADWIANNALPSGPAFEFFKKRIGTHLLVLDDNLFVHLVRLATVVEPHVKINDDTGTAEGTAFFYAEHLPPDSVLWSLVGVGRPRLKPDPDPKSGERVDLKALELVDAAAVGQYLRDQLDGKAVQVGAEATTGRGLVHLRFAPGGRDEEQRA
jgi:CRISPR-associated protein Cmr4